MLVNKSMIGGPNSGKNGDTDVKINQTGKHNNKDLVVDKDELKNRLTGKMGIVKAEDQKEKDLAK